MHRRRVGALFLEQGTLFDSVGGVLMSAAARVVFRV